MRKILIAAVLIMFLASSVSALDITAPAVPESGRKYMPRETDNLLEGIAEVLRSAIYNLRPDIREAARVCTGVTASILACSFLSAIPAASGKITDMICVIAVASQLLSAANSLIRLGSDTIVQISEYGKLLLPVMTGAMAAGGGVTGSTVLYALTAVLDSVLSTLIANVLTPMIYVYLALSSAGAALGEDLLKKLRGMIKGVCVWLIKTLLYVYTGFLSITGVVAGTTDAAAMKAAKLTISGAVPVVGGILSDASEAFLVGIGTVKNAAGLYGLFAILSIWIGPFLRIGAHYLILKATGALCSVFCRKPITELLEDFTAAMGLLLGMTGAECLTLVISTICFMKGVG